LSHKSFIDVDSSRLRTIVKKSLAYGPRRT
jgi:hypothetical protein